MAIEFKVPCFRGPPNVCPISKMTDKRNGRFRTNFYFESDYDIVIMRKLVKKRLIQM